MSLKAIHIIFVAASTLLCFGFAAWAFRAFSLSGGWANLLLGITSLVGGVALLVYGRYFLRKLKHISYL